MVLHDLTHEAIAILIAATGPGGYPNKSSQIVLARSPDRCRDRTTGRSCICILQRASTRTRAHALASLRRLIKIARIRSSSSCLKKAETSVA